MKVTQYGKGKVAWHGKKEWRPCAKYHANDVALHVYRYVTFEHKG